MGTRVAPRTPRRQVFDETNQASVVIVVHLFDVESILINGEGDRDDNGCMKYSFRNECRSLL